MKQDKNRVYYGEYSLKHWIDLMTSKNIVLPVYQRHFAWDEEKIYELFKTFKNDYFVPPVIISAHKKEDNSFENLILDGQQRLTSLLLAYLGIVPNTDKIKKATIHLADENDDDDEEEDDSTVVIKWRYDELLENSAKDIDSIKKSIDNSIYDALDKSKLGFDNEDKLLKFFEEHYLGFSYLVPSSSDEKFQQKFFSTTFRNINLQGVDLLTQESREALYFLDANLYEILDPEFCAKITKGKGKLDFVRYLSMCSQYYEEQTNINIAKGYGRGTLIEKYYEDFIYRIEEDSDNNLYKFFHRSDLKDKISKLEKAANDLKLFGRMNSIIDMDGYFFGLTYCIVFMGQDLNSEGLEKFKERIAREIENWKKDEKHRKKPATLKYLRERIVASITFCKLPIEKRGEED